MNKQTLSSNKALGEIPLIKLKSQYVGSEMLGFWGKKRFYKRNIWTYFLALIFIRCLLDQLEFIMKLQLHLYHVFAVFILFLSILNNFFSWFISIFCLKKYNSYLSTFQDFVKMIVFQNWSDESLGKNPVTKFFFWNTFSFGIFTRILKYSVYMIQSWVTLRICLKCLILSE